MRIVAVVGIWNFPVLYRPIWRHFEGAFKKRFPGTTFSVEDVWYSPWQGEKMRAFANRIVKKYDDGGEDILILGYSMGGVIAIAIAPQFKRTNVCGVITVCAPHTFLWGLFPRMLGANLQEIKTPVVSCAGRFDLLVLWGARYPKATKHVRVACGHLFRLLCSKHPAEVIADAAALQ